MNHGLKMRWRILTRDEIFAGGPGSVSVRINEYNREECVLEFMVDGQTIEDFWQQVPVAVS